ncbi:MAG TPA: cation-translocating P-type ATPase [Arenimonas sp.]|uniref:cation-translocating P-type ATPase n=1 Tax=Arenimonas sp. TaxID=1872635 RepID=UPI002D7F5217|nr:cation-translocating P-type ATPase [Arenimonas sp.]HEU0153624.1 cation-translocating P-type ATPase [Arenimonas sp.]
MTDPLAATPATGLTNEEAARRLAQFGRNALPAPAPRGLLRIVREVLTEPMFLLLVLAAASYLLLGDLGEGLLLGAFAVLTIGLVVMQERRGERALQALQALGTPVATVLREGAARRIASPEVVPGDLLLVEEGERVAADGVLQACRGLSVDESLLTGESVPVSKRPARAGDPDGADPGGDDLPFLYAGTLVAAGEGRLRVTATGLASQAGRIGRSLAVIETEATRLQRDTRRLVRLFGGFAGVVSLAMLLFHGLVRGEWVDGLLGSIALAMGLLPEEFPLVLTVFFAIGAWRLTKVKVLARRSAVIETLGAATVLCVDKTGTLTENRMRIRRLDAGGPVSTLGDEAVALDAAQRELLDHAFLATRPQSFDPMDRAVGELALAARDGRDPLNGDWSLGRHYGLTPDLLAMSQAWRTAPGHHAFASKGAPEAVADLCHLSTAEKAHWMARVATLAADGLRVLAVAAGDHRGPALPEDPHDVRFRWLGLVGFEDPLRPSVPGAIEEARRAGLAVNMITGDFPATALAIARQAGIDTRAGALAGAALDALDDAALRAALDRTHVFARIRPEQKLRLVEAFKARGDVVAMTGDGVNDAPALKAAHIGIAMGQRGSDVAREASAMVLLDEDFGGIVAAVAVGRRIFDNLRKVMLYIVAIHIPIAGLAMLPLLLGLPPLLLPPHVVLVEMIIDPMCSVAFENEPAEPDAMRQAPRPLAEPLVGARQLWVGLAQGLALLAACLVVYVGALGDGRGADVARTLAFLALTAGNLMLVRSNASRRSAFRPAPQRRMAFWAITGVASAVVLACVAIPGMRALFGFGLPSASQALLAIGAGLLGGSLLELGKTLPWVRAAIGHAPAARAD